MRHLMPLLAAAASVLSTAPAYADLGDQLFKLLPDDGAANEYFGYSVAISPDGIGAIVGAYWDDDNGTSSGSAYLFDTTTGRRQWHPQAGFRAVASRHGVDPEPQRRGFDHP